MNTMIPEIGSSFRFLPACFMIQGGNPMALPFSAPESLYVTGTVVQVHEDHRWFRVEYENRNGTMHECFKFLGGRVMDFVCPYKCSYRTNSGYCGSTGGWERCQYRQLYQPNTVVGYVPPLKKTNADRIRSMIDEELAELLRDYQCNTCDLCGFCEETDKCKEEIFEWLKQENETN